MLRLRDLATVLIMLTQLDGRPIWVESTAIIAVKPAHEAGQCHHPYGAAVRVGTTNLCVKETTDEIRQRVRDAK